MRERNRIYRYFLEILSAVNGFRHTTYDACTHLCISLDPHAVACVVDSEYVGVPGRLWAFQITPKIRVDYERIMAMQEGHGALKPVAPHLRTGLLL